MNDKGFFRNRRMLWDGLGTEVKGSTDYKEALKEAGLDWKVEQRALYTADGTIVDGWKANVRETDDKVLGLVSERYKVVQNIEAFSFISDLMGMGMRLEAAGTIQDGKRSWVVGSIQSFVIQKEQINPYLVFLNSHDASSGIKIFITPVRVQCANTLALALSKAKYSWSIQHTGDVESKINAAKNVLKTAEEYMISWAKEMESLSEKLLSEEEVNLLLEELLPVDEDATPLQIKNTEKMRKSISDCYYHAEDLQHLGFNAYRFLNSVADYLCHCKPIRQTAFYKENLFLKGIDSGNLINQAYELVAA